MHNKRMHRAQPQQQKPSMITGTLTEEFGSHADCQQSANQHSSARDSTAQQLMQASNELSTTSQAVRPQHLLGKGQLFGRRSLGLHELVAPCCQLLMEDPVSQPMAVCQSVCEPSTAAHHLFNCAAVEGQQLTDLEAEHQGQVGCQHLLYADLQHR